MYKVIVIDDEMLVRRGIVMETDWQALNCVCPKWTVSKC